MARYFVTGATGFIGGALARQLVAAGHTVVAIARSRPRASGLLAIGVDVVDGDVTNRDSLIAPMRGVDGVFHVAGWYRIGVRDASEAQRVNVDGTRNVLSVMQQLAIPRGVYTSTLAVNGDTHGQIVDETYRVDGPWLSEYDRTKWAAHYEVAEPMMQSGLPLIVVQPGAVYGPGDVSPQGRLLRQYLEQTLPVIPRGAALCWAHVDDTARGHILAMERGRVGERYIIAGQPASIAEVLAFAERQTGIPAPRARATPGLLRLVASVASVIERVAPVPETLSSEYFRVAAGVTYLGSSRKAATELGFTVRPLAEGLQATLQAELHQLREPRDAPDLRDPAR